MTSPLGRYGAGDHEQDEQREVRLLRTPVRVFAAAREHHDDLMRELSLLALSASARPAGEPARLTELIQVLGGEFGAATARPTAEIEHALEAGWDTVDLVFTVPAGVVAAGARLQGLMDEADAFCRAEQLLTVRRTDVIRTFSHWYLEEFRRQVAGEPPSPWTGPLEP